MFEFNTQEIRFNTRGIHRAGRGWVTLDWSMSDMSLTDALFRNSRLSSRDRELTTGFINGRSIDNLHDAVVDSICGIESAYLSFSAAESVIFMYADAKDYSVTLFILRPTPRCDEWFVHGNSNEEVLLKLMDSAAESGNIRFCRALRISIERASKRIPSRTLEELLEYARAAFG